MDCLSYFSNSDFIQHQDCFITDLDMIIPEIDTFFPRAQPHHHEEALPPFPFGFNHMDPFYEPLLPPQDIFLSNPKTKVLVESRDLDSFFPTLTNTCFQFNAHNSSFPIPNPNPLDSYIAEASNISEFLLSDFSRAFKIGWSGPYDTKKPALSVQSIAARKRRRRITEKTQELGKQIPGSQKYNTAEMFQAAAKYVKFMQAQIEILQLMQTKIQTPGSNSKAEGEMQFLLLSQEIQEKLSTEELCVVPTETVQVLRFPETLISFCLDNFGFHFIQAKSLSVLYVFKFSFTLDSILARD